MNKFNTTDSKNIPFDPTKINMSSKVVSLYNIIQRIKHNEIEVPTYQRNEVWKKKAKSQFIESLIVKIPVPLFYIDASDETRWRIIDGLQRITTIREFIVDKTLKLEELEYIVELNGKKFDELDRSYQRRIDETEFTVIFINAGTPENVKFNIFRRINTGGLPLSPQEIRNALYDGVANSLLEKISKEKYITEIWGDDNERMDNNEVILRGLGYWFLDLEEIAEDTFDNYLNRVMKIINNSSKNQIDEKIKNYIFSYCSCIKIFGDQTFRKFSYKRKRPINKNIYETWMSIFSQLTVNQLNKLVKEKEKVIQVFIELLNNRSFNFAISSRKRDSIKARYNQLNQALKEIYND